MRQRHRHHSNHPRRVGRVDYDSFAFSDNFRIPSAYVVAARPRPGRAPTVAPVKGFGDRDIDCTCAQAGHRRAAPGSRRADRHRQPPRLLVQDAARACPPRHELRDADVAHRSTSPAGSAPIAHPAACPTRELAASTDTSTAATAATWRNGDSAPTRSARAPTPTNRPATPTVAGRVARPLQQKDIPGA